MNKLETAAWVARRIRRFAQDLAYVAPELYPEKFELLSREIKSTILRITDGDDE